MRSHIPLQRLLAALCATVCLVAAATPAGAVPTENVGRQPTVSQAVPSPTIVRETIVRPSDNTDPIVFVLIGVAAIVGMVGAGITGARIATRRVHTPS